MHAYVEEWRNIPTADHDAESVTRGFIDGFYRLLSEHRELVMALVTAQAYESLQEVSDASPLTRLLEELETLAGTEAAARGFHFDVPVATRVATGMVMGMALLDEWLFQPGRRKPSRQRIVDEMVAFMLHGLAHRDEAAPPATSAGDRLAGGADPVGEGHAELHRRLLDGVPPRSSGSRGDDR